MIIESLGMFGGSGLVKARTPALPAIAIQSELRHHQERSTGIDDIPVHLSGAIGKDSQSQDLVRKKVNFRFGVGFCHSGQYH
jgi:hypothetical protein